MPASAMTAPGGPLEAHPGKPGRHCHEHEQGRQRGRGEQEPPDGKAWGGGGVTGAPGGSAAVVSKRDGRRQIVGLCASEAPPCGRETTRSRFGVTAFRDEFVGKKSRPGEAGGKFAVTPPMPLRGDRRPRHATKSPMRRPECDQAVRQPHRHCRAIRFFPFANMAARSRFPWLVAGPRERRFGGVQDRSRRLVHVGPWPANHPLNRPPPRRARLPA